MKNNFLLNVKEMHCEIPYDDLIKIIDKNAISAYFVKISITNVEQSFIIDNFFSKFSTLPTCH